MMPKQKFQQQQQQNPTEVNKCTDTPRESSVWDLFVSHLFWPFNSQNNQVCANGKRFCVLCFLVVVLLRYSLCHLL